MTGATQVTDLPVLNAYQPTPAPGSTESAFVAKYNPAGQMLWCTYLGGNNQSMGVGVAATPNGGVAVVGITTSSGSGSFPTLKAFQSENKGQSDYFVTVFDAKGKLQYSTYLGGSGLEGGVGVNSGQIIFNDDSNNGNCVAVDANGRVYVGGMTTSGGGSGEKKFPVTPNALQSNLAGSRNASLTILDPSRSGAASLVYSSFLGGDRDSQGHSVAVDPSGRYITVGGFTTSSSFPTTPNAYQSTAPSGGFSPNSSNGFVTQFQSSQPGSPSSQYTMRYSTYMGANSSTARDDVYGMTVDPSGIIVATGRTQSSGFPMTQGGPTIFNQAPYLQEGVSGDEPFIVKINPSLNGGASLAYATFLGGGSASKNWGSWNTSVAVDARGAVYVGGETDAQGAPYVSSNLTAPETFPYTTNALIKAPRGSEDALLMQINPNGDYLDYSTYLGGTLSDRTYGLVVDPDGNVVLSGLTFSSNFPLKNPAQTWPGKANYQNAFVTVFSPLYTPANVIIDSGASYTVTGDITYDNDYIGQNSTGTLIQGGFTNTVNNNLKLGQNAGASGAYNLSGGSLSVGGNAYVGYSGAGRFTQTGGTHTVSGDLFLAVNAGSSGAYNLSGGSLTVGAYEAVGYSGAGTFNQSGGTHTVTALYLGADAGASGAYNLSGGSLSVGGNAYVGIFGSGAFDQTGGANTVSGDLHLAANSGSSGAYNLSGGSLSVGTITLNSGGTFTQSGGALSVSSDSDPGGGVLNINGGALQASGGPHILGNDLKVGGDFALGGANNFTLSGAVDLGGSTRTITLTNSGDTNLSGIISNGGLSIDNTGAGSLTLSGANTYTGTTTLHSGTLLAGNNEAFNATGGANLIIKGGAIGASAAGISITNPLTIGGDFNMGGAAGTTLELTKTMNLAGFLLTHNGASEDTLKGNLTSTASGGITVTAGTLNLTGSNGGYIGTSTVMGGALNLQGAGNYSGNNTVSGGALNMNSASAITYSGSNTVSGGTLNMSSAGSTYSGPATLSGGTLNLSAGTLSGLLTLNGGAFNLSGTGTYTNAAPLTNSAGNTLNVAPGSTLTLAGGLTNNGNMDVNGTLNADLTNGVGSTLKGNGTINGTVTSSGATNPGNSPGTLNVVGSYTQTASGSLKVEVASPASYDKLSVTGAPGSASLNGAIVPVLLGGYQPRGNQVFADVITATGGVRGAFSTILNQQISPTLLWQASYRANGVDLWVQRDYANSSLGLNTSQQAVGMMLNSVANATGGDLDTVLNAIDTLPDGGSVRGVFKQISPEKAGALTGLGFMAANFQMRHLASRTANQRFVLGESAGGGSAAAGSFSFNYSRQEGMMLAYNGASLPQLFSARKNYPAPESRWGLYADGGMAFGNQGSSINQTGYNFTLGGCTLGADYRLRDNLLIGLATGYSNTGAAFFGSKGNVNANTLPVNAYAAYFGGALYAYGSLGYALNLYDLSRALSFNGIGRRAASSTTGNQFNLYGETGYDLKLNRFILTPSATLSFSALWVGGFTENGAGSLNLKVGSQSAASAQTGLGARLTVPLKLGSMQVAPQAYAFYQHEFADGSRGINASLSQGGSALTYKTDAAKRNFALVGASVTARLKSNLYAQANFNAEIGRGNSQAQAFNAGLRYEF